MSQAVIDFDDEDGRNDTELNEAIVKRCAQIKKISITAEARLTDMLQLQSAIHNNRSDHAPPPDSFHDKIVKAFRLGIINDSLAGSLHRLRRWRNLISHEDNNSNNRTLVELVTHEPEEVEMAALMTRVNDGLNRAKASLAGRLG